MTQKEIADSLRAAYANSSTAELDTLLARKIPELWEEFGSYRVEKGCMGMIDCERFFSVAALREYIVAIPPITAKVLEPNTECSLCRDTGYIDAGNGRVKRCNCPPEARRKYNGLKAEPVNINAEIRKLGAAVDLRTPPPDADETLGFHLVECNPGTWHLRSQKLANGFRVATEFEAILWRAYRFWRMQHFRDTRTSATVGHDQPIAAAEMVTAGDVR